MRKDKSIDIMNPNSFQLVFFNYNDYNFAKHQAK